MFNLKPRVFARAAAGHRRRLTRSIDTRKLVDPFGISMRNDRALDPWRTARYRLIPRFPAFPCADLACFIAMSTTPG